jgi:hypothetical protein
MSLVELFGSAARYHLTHGLQRLQTPWVGGGMALAGTGASVSLAQSVWPTAFWRRSL